MRHLLTLTGADLRQRVRDKSVLIFALVVPIAFMAVLNLVFGDMEDLELDAVTVAAAVADDDELGNVVIGALSDVPGLDVTVDHVSADEVRPRAEDGSAALGISIPMGFGSDLVSGQATTIDMVEGDGAGIETDILIAVVQAVTDRFTAAAATTRAGATLGLAPEQLDEIGQTVAAAEASVTATSGETATEQLNASAMIVAGQAGLFLLFTVGFGVIALINEREQGTLARLRSMPIRPELIVGSKALSAYLLGVAATGVLLSVGSLLFDVSFGSIPLIVLLVLAVVAAGTSLTFIVARVARTAEQAGVTQSILALVLGMSGGAFFPVMASGVAGRILDLNPIAAFTRGLGITAGGGGLSDLVTPLGIMVGFAVVCAAISRLVPDRGALV